MDEQQQLDELNKIALPIKKVVEGVFGVHFGANNALYKVALYGACSRIERHTARIMLLDDHYSRQFAHGYNVDVTVVENEGPQNTPQFVLSRTIPRQVQTDVWALDREEIDMFDSWQECVRRAVEVLAVYEADLVIQKLAEEQAQREYQEDMDEWLDRVTKNDGVP